LRTLTGRKLKMMRIMKMQKATLVPKVNGKK